MLRDRRINNCRGFKVAITLRVMIANKNWTVIDAPILSTVYAGRYVKHQKQKDLVRTSR